MQSVAQMWQDFRGKVMHPQASEDQVREMRRAFYAGVWATLMEFHGIGDDSVSEERGVEHLERIRKECEAFAASVQSGKA